MKMLKLLSTLAILGGIAAIVAVSSVRAGTTIAKLSDGKLDTVYSSDGKSLTNISVEKTPGDASSITVFTANQNTLIKDKLGGLMSWKYLKVADTVTVWAPTIANGSTAAKIIDKTTWKTSLSGSLTRLNDSTYKLIVSKPIRELGVNATYDVSVESSSDTKVVQIEISKTGNRSTRAEKTKSLSDIVSGTSYQVIVTGYWHKNSSVFQATKIQLPNKTVTALSR